MTQPRRAVNTDPESARPVLLPVDTEAEERGALGDEPLPEPPPKWALALSALLPGSGHFVTGAWVRGLLVMLGWGLLLGVAYLGWERISALPGRWSWEDAVATATLACALALLWGLTLRDLLRARARRALQKSDSQWRIAARHFQRNWLALAGLAVIVVLYLAALLAPLLAPHDPIEQIDIVGLRYLPPSIEYPLGTDRFGRDILSRILFGARISLAIAFIAVAISITLGTLIGAVAGYLGGRTDSLLMRFTDMVLSFPRLILLIMIIALFSPSIALVIAVLGLTQWPGTTRIVRGDVLSLRERDFIQAARALGMGKTRIIMRHLIPNVLAPIIVAATLGIGNTIVLEAGLSFLGLGVQPPTPSWGNMVAEGRQNLIGAWWVATFPGLAIVITVLAFNLVGDGLRDALDPRLRS